MKVLIADTETTGIPYYGADHRADAIYQPRLCSVAAALLDGPDIVARFDALIRPGPDWPLTDPRFLENMEQARIKAHGLTFDRLMEEGRPVAEAHAQWQVLYKQCEFFSSFVATFDHKILRGEWRRLGDDIPFRDRQFICLMHSAAPHVKGKPAAKQCSLKDAVKVLLGREHQRAHDAGSDLDAAIEVYRYLLPINGLIIEDQPEAKKKPTQGGADENAG